MSRTISITTKAKATAILNQTPGAYRFPYCTGKYKWTGSSKDWLEKTFEAGDNCHAIYVERRQDSHGPYAKLMCIQTNEPVASTQAPVDTPVEELARQQVREAVGRDGELEVDEGCPVHHLWDCTYDVQVWVWVSNEDAGIKNNDDHSEEEREAAYLNAALTGAVTSDAEFRGEAEVSLGDDDGSYVSAWVTQGVFLEGNEEDEAA